MPTFDELADAAQQAGAADVHSRPVTDADIGETATEGAQVGLEGSQPAAPTGMQQPAAVPIAPANNSTQATEPEPMPMTSQPSTAMPEGQAPIPQTQPAIPIVTPVAGAAPAAPSAREPLTPFNPDMAAMGAASTPPPAAQSTPQSATMTVPHPDSAPTAQQAESAPQPAQAEQSTAPPAAGTMPGQTVAPTSHIIPDSYPKPVTGADPMGGIAA